jgi:hypothetical protein
MARAQSGFVKTIFDFSMAVTWKQHFFAEIPVWTYWAGQVNVAPAGG